MEMGQKKRFVGAEEMLRLSWQLAAAVWSSGWRPAGVLGLWRGGAGVAAAVQEALEGVCGWRMWDLPLKCSSWPAVGVHSGRVDALFGRETFEEVVRLGGPVLVVDDLVETG